jgi:hypothetical protein
MASSHNHSRGRVNLVIGALLVGLGALFLLGQLFNVDLWQFFWPFFIIVPGLLFFVGMVLGGKPAGPLAIPGSIVTTVGLLLLYQSITGHWESWAYAWALILPTSVGIGLSINGAWSDVERLVTTGAKWITVGIALFLIGGVFFELILNISDNFIGNVVWPGLLIAFGLYLLLRRGGIGGGNHRHVEKPPVQTPVEEAPPSASGPEFEPIGEGHKDV